MRALGGGGFGGLLLLDVGGERRRSHGDGRLLLLLHRPLVLRRSLVVLPETHVPRQAAHGRHRLELVHHAARDVVDVVIVQLDARVTDPLATQLVQLGVVHPLHALYTHTHTHDKPSNTHTHTHHREER